MQGVDKSAVKVPSNDTTTLTEKRERFAQMIAIGWTQSDAYRAVHPRTKATDESINQCASRWAAEPEVKSRVKALLKEMPIVDVISPAQYVRDTLDMRDHCMADEAYTAAASFNGQAGRAIGLGGSGSEVNLTVTNISVDARQVTDRLSQGDATRRSELAKLLVDAGDFDSEDD